MQNSLGLTAIHYSAYYGNYVSLSALILEIYHKPHGE